MPADRARGRPAARRAARERRLPGRGAGEAAGATGSGGCVLSPRPGLPRCRQRQASSRGTGCAGGAFPAGSRPPAGCGGKDDAMTTVLPRTGRATGRRAICLRRRACGARAPLRPAQERPGPCAAVLSPASSFGTLPHHDPRPRAAGPAPGGVPGGSGFTFGPGYARGRRPRACPLAARPGSLRAGTGLLPGRAGPILR